MRCEVAFRILCIAALAAPLHGAPGGYPGNCDRRYTIYPGDSDTLDTPATYSTPDFEMGPVCEGCSSRDYYDDDEYFNRPARSHGTSTPTTLTPVSRVFDPERPPSFEESDSFSRVVYEQIPTGRSSKLYVIRPPVEPFESDSDNRDESEDEQRPYGLLGSEEIDEIVRKVLAEVKKSRNRKSQTFRASDVVYRPHIRHNPHNLDPNTRLYRDSFDGTYEMPELDANPVYKDSPNFHLDDDITATIADDSTSRETIIAPQDDKIQPLSGPEVINFTDDVIASAGVYDSVERGNDDLAEETAPDDQKSMGVGVEFETEPTETNEPSRSGEPEDDDAIDPYILDDVEEPTFIAKSVEESVTEEDSTVKE